ncbi:hypothetical protein JOF56_004169 [Kibdelosporangium banguiense]|uniref:Integral membrane plasmid transfer protein n=1 Tax=Kibdelosporangium banguiense TaxID=1365924 RepID=A0ABS4TIE2_9PSEU|nr:hypothetical protein [Kibdelosporangium banguiense]MBP2323784.1 hypothetical protein [Kibdelosporangium banguiense]
MTQEGSSVPPPGQRPETELAGPVIAEFIAKQVETAQNKTSSLQARGLAVISSCGTLVVLLFGLSAIATKAQNFTLPTATKLPLFLAAIFLVLAAFVGITTNAPRQSDAVALHRLRPLLEDNLWATPAANAQKEIAKTLLTVAEAERRRNMKMARLLQVAIALEIAGITFVTLSIIVFIAAG